MTKLKMGKRSGLRYFDIADIRSWKPCYDPSRHLAEDWRGTAVTILKNEAIPFRDRVWVVCRSEIISERVVRLFALWCARQVQHLMTDKRSTDALNVAERFANGQATQAEVFTARNAAADVARDADDWAARAAAWAAVWPATGAAAFAAGDAADAAGDAAVDAQRDKIIDMVIAEGKERVRK